MFNIFTVCAPLVMGRLGKVGGIIALILVVVLLICLSPMIFLWSVNSLAELGGADFYIEHSLWSYWVSLVFMAMVKGSTGSKS